ncbi:MAG: acetyltransferase-like isoleucine patch superfamily enzyme [Dokdonia donghaensis]|jgi:acetyltransferase-like isoleucine patch superfamily enzyme
MIKILKLFNFIPFVNRMLERKYYATGIGTYVLNSFVKVILRINAPSAFLLHFTSRVNNASEVKFTGNNLKSVYLSLATSGGCYYQAINGIEFGEGTIWAYNCSFISANHSSDDLTKHNPSKPIVIGKNVWLGSNCVVLPEVRIGDNSIIGAGAIVTKNIPDFSIAVGNPAKVIAKICSRCLKKNSLETVCSCLNSL